MIGLRNIKTNKMQPQIILVFVLVITLFSCQPKSTSSINYKKLNTVCDFIDAANDVADESITLAGDRKFEQLNENERKRLFVLRESFFTTINELEARFSLQYNKDEAKQCNNYQELRNKINKFFDHYFKEYEKRIEDSISISKEIEVKRIADSIMSVQKKFE
jgi:hypothetical protein